MVQKCEAIQASLEDLVPWMPINAETEESAEEIVRNAHGQFLLRETLDFHLYDKVSGTFIGAITLKPRKLGYSKVFTSLLAT